MIDPKFAACDAMQVSLVSLNETLRVTTILFCEFAIKTAHAKARFGNTRKRLGFYLLAAKARKLIKDTE